MVGGLRLPEEADGLSEMTFPFSETLFNRDLMQAICGYSGDELIPPMEPDVIGEWFVLRMLSGDGPFDSASVELFAAVEQRVAASNIDADYFAAFRSRSIYDFRNEFCQSVLLQPPASDAPAHVVCAWCDFLKEAFELLIDWDPAYTRYTFDNMHLLRVVYSDNEDVQLSTASTHASYARALIKLGDPKAAIGLFDDLVSWAVKEIRFPGIGWVASALGQDIGEERLQAGDEIAADSLFEQLRDHAFRFQSVVGAEHEEIAEDAASLGLSIRRYRERKGNLGAVEASNMALWLRPAGARTIDLAGRTAQVLMERDRDRDLGSPQDIYCEVKQRSLARPDIKEIGFWAANIGYGLARDALADGNGRLFVETVRDLAAWVATREDWPDMGDVVAEMIDEGWIDLDFSLGPKSAETLYELWAAARSAAQHDGIDPNRSNSVRSLRIELDMTLNVHPDSAWVRAIRAKM